MDTEFNTEKLLVRNRGAERAKKIMLRKTQLENVDNMEQLRSLPGHYHALTGNRLGWYAVVTILGVLNYHEQTNKEPS